MWKTCKTCALTCRAIIPPSRCPFRSSLSRLKDRWRYGLSRGGFEDRDQIRLCPRSPGAGRGRPTELTEDGRIFMWLLVCYGFLWLISCYFIFFWRFYGLRDFWRCPMILNGGIWRYMIGKYEITRRGSFFTCELWVKFSLKALRYCNSKKWCGDSAQLLYLRGFPCTLKFWPGPMWKSAQSPAAILYTNDGRARCYSWVCR